MSHIRRDSPIDRPLHSDSLHRAKRESKRKVTKAWGQPCDRNGYLQEHVARLLESYARWTGRRIVNTELPPVEQARRLFHAPFVLLSHDTAPDPILNYSNQAGLSLFQLTWEELNALPSRLTAESVEQAQREQLLATVAKRGHLDNYRGVRITKTGRRFMIEQAAVWNLTDEDGAYYGQAAMFSRWKYID